MPVCQESGVLLWRGALFRTGKHGGHVAGPTEIFQQHHAHQRLDRDLNYWRACGTRQSTGVRGRLPRRHRAPLYLLPMLMRALFGEHLTALRAEIAPHVARTVAFFLAACRQGGIGWTKRQRRQKQGSRTCFVSCCKSHRSRPAVFYSAIGGAPHRLRRLRGVELPVALFDAASPLVPRNGTTDMVRASCRACSGDFLLRLAICQSKHLFAKGG